MPVAPARVDELTALLATHGFSTEADRPAGAVASLDLGRARTAVDQAVHELNNATTAVTANLMALVYERGGVTHLSSDWEGILEDCSEALARIKDVSRRLRTSVADLAQVPHEDVDLVPLVARAAASLEGGRFSVQAPPSLVVQADLARLQAVVRGVLQAGVNHGLLGVDSLVPVRVYLREEGGRAVLSVDGDGPGLDYGAVEALLLNTFKAPRLTAPPPGNLGFALNFLSELGGELRVEGRPDGSRWIDVYLPLDGPVPL